MSERDESETRNVLYPYKTTHVDLNLTDTHLDPMESMNAHFC